VTELFRIEDSPLRWALPLGMGGIVLVIFVYALLQGGSATGWIGWAVAAGFAAVLFVEYRRQSTGKPFLVATESGLWIKDLDCLGEIPWSAIDGIQRRPLTRRIELHFVERRPWLDRLTFWRMGHSVTLVTLSKIGFTLRFTGASPDEVVAVLREIWAARQEAR
jgi:hypothetical protein